jgi:hypothetical protein
LWSSSDILRQPVVVLAILLKICGLVQHNFFQWNNDKSSGYALKIISLLFLDQHFEKWVGM